MHLFPAVLALLVSAASLRAEGIDTDRPSKNPTPITTGDDLKKNRAENVRATEEVSPASVRRLKIEMKFFELSAAIPAEVLADALGDLTSGASLSLEKLERLPGATLLQAPTIIAVHGHEAEAAVGEEVSYQDGLTKKKTELIGLTLRVLPRVGPQTAKLDLHLVHAFVEGFLETDTGREPVISRKETKTRISTSLETPDWRAVSFQMKEKTSLVLGLRVSRL